MQFFQFIGGNIKATLDNYIQFCEKAALSQEKIDITKSWRRNVLRNRSSLYDQMSKLMEIDPEFFIRNAPSAIWNGERKYFNLISGKHRTSFLISKGKLFITLDISKEDYNEWYDEVNSNIIKKHLKKHGKDNLEVFVATPPFLGLQQTGELCIRKFWVEIVQNMAVNTRTQNGYPVLKNKNILCRGLFSEYFELYLKKINVNIFRRGKKNKNMTYFLIKKLIDFDKDLREEIPNDVKFDFEINYIEDNKTVSGEADICYFITERQISFADIENNKYTELNILSNSIIEGKPIYLFVAK